MFCVETKNDIPLFLTIIVVMYLTNNDTRNYLLARNNKDMEVIGNIYDNPELLEVQK